MNIEKSQDIRKWIGDTFDSMAMALPPTVDQKCCHCGLVMRHPLVARERDVERLEGIIRAAYVVMDKHGITANLLADIFTQCHLAIAAKNAKDTK